MPITFACPACSAKIKAPDESAGLISPCPRCRHSVRIPRRVEHSGFPVIPQKPPPERAVAVADAPPSRPSRIAFPEAPSCPLPPTPHPGAGVAVGLGACSLILGLCSLPFTLVPCCGSVVALPLAALAGVVGLVGILVSWSSGTSSAFPVAGSLVSLMSMGLSLGWFLFLASPFTKAPSLPRPISAPAPSPLPPPVVYLDYLSWKVGDTGEFPPDQTWRFVRFYDETDPSFAILAQSRSEARGVCVPTHSGQIESKPSREDPEIKTIRLLGKWRVVARFTPVDGLTLYSIVPSDRQKDQ